MKNKCTVIQLGGLRGIFILGFVIMCAVAGFIIFPAWCCQHVWNFIAGYVVNMPLMELKHGALLWVILALIAYATYFNRFKIAVVSSADEVIKGSGMPLSDEEIIAALEKRISEKRLLNDSKKEVATSSTENNQTTVLNEETSNE